MYKKIAVTFYQLKQSINNFSLAQLTNQLQELLKADASPRQLAQGFAVGTFISILPTPGLNILLATILLGLFKQLNKMALFAALAVWNTLIVAPLYALSGKLGALFFTLSPLQAIDGFVSQYLNAAVKHFVVGNVVLAVAITAVSYLLVQTAVSIHQKRSQIREHHSFFMFSLRALQ